MSTRATATPKSATVVVGLLLAGRPRGKHWAYDIARRGQLYNATAWWVLRRMERDGWLTSKVEDRAGRPGRPRRLFRLTRLGIVQVREVCAFADGNPLFEQWMPDRLPVLPAGVIPAQVRRRVKETRDSKQDPPAPRECGACRHCERIFTLRLDETVPGHPDPTSRQRVGCPGSYLYPAKQQATQTQR